jgi:hypothetical protein
VYLGYVIGGGELKIDPMKMEAILKWPVPTNVTEVRSFFGVNTVPMEVYSILFSCSCTTSCHNNLVVRVSSGERINIEIF